MILTISHFSFFFFFNDTATTEIYTLSLHDALPISMLIPLLAKLPEEKPLQVQRQNSVLREIDASLSRRDRKSTRLNSSHGYISYAVFCLKKKKDNRSKVYSRT